MNHHLKSLLTIFLSIFLLPLASNAALLNIEPEQIVRWIGIYSIVFSNEDFLSYAGTRPNFRRMRDLISNLSMR